TRLTTTCQIANGTAAMAAATWYHIASNGPSCRSSPVECSSPATSDTITSAASTNDGHDAGPVRRVPRRAMIDFHGSRARIAKPLVAWTTSDQRDGAVANANASHPVVNAAASRPSSATLVRAPRAMGTFNLDFIIA